MTHWRLTVDVSAFSRRVSAAKASQCDCIRGAAARLTELAKRPLLQRVCLRSWLQAATSKSHRLHEAIARREDSDVRTHFDAWRECSLLARHGRSHRRRLLEVLAPQCARARMCLAAWERAVHISRCSRDAELRYRAIDIVTNAMASRHQATKLLRGAFQTLAKLAQRSREFRLAQLAQQQGKAEHLSEEFIACLPRRTEALTNLVITHARSLTTALAMMALGAWRSLAAATGPHFPPSEEVTEVVRETRQTECKSIVSHRPSINGRPPSAATASFHGTSAKRSQLSTAATSAHRFSVTQAADREVIGPRLPAEMQRSPQCGDGASPAMRRMHSDPAISTKLPAPGIGLAAIKPLPLAHASPASSEFHGRLAAALQAHRLNSTDTPRSQSDRCGVQASGQQNFAQKEIFGPQFSCDHGSSASTTGTSTPCEILPAASERSTCCPSTPRSSCGVPDAVPLHSDSAIEDLSRIPFGPQVQPPSNLQVPIGPLVTPSGSLTAPVCTKLATNGSLQAGSAEPQFASCNLHRSCSSGATRSLSAADLSWPPKKMNLSPSWQRAAPKACTLSAWAQTLPSR